MSSRSPGRRSNERCDVLQEIPCPNCGKAFTIDEAGYADILKQVRDTDFERQLHDRLERAEQEKQRAIELADTKAAGELQKAAAAKDSEILALKVKLDAGEFANKVAVELAEAKLAAKLADESAKLEAEVAKKASEIELLKASILNGQQAKQLAVKEALSEVERERDELKNGLAMATMERQVSEQALEEKYKQQIKDRDDAIERLKDMKARLSAKMVGETLEQHYETEFNRIRATAFPKAYFEKDNNARGASKGGFIFRDYSAVAGAHDAGGDGPGVEIVSIMFEMKNENDTTATKKNEDFLKELEKDRAAKGCEYAALVSLQHRSTSLKVKQTKKS